MRDRRGYVRSTRICALLLSQHALSTLPPTTTLPHKGPTGVSSSFGTRAAVSTPPFPLDRNSLLARVDKSIALESLTPETAVTHLELLHRTHVGLGLATTASSVRWRARVFLKSLGAAPPLSGWAMMESLALSILISSAHFELAVFECPCGAEAVQFLDQLWKKRRDPNEAEFQGLRKDMDAQSDAALQKAAALGRLTMAVMGQLRNGTITFSPTERNVLERFLCGALLPATLEWLRVGFSSPQEECGMMEAMALEAFSTLSAALTKAAIGNWAIRTPTNGLIFTPSIAAADAVDSFKDIREWKGNEVLEPLPVGGLVTALRRFALGIPKVSRRDGALSVLRFFIHTHCLPLLVESIPDETRMHSHEGHTTLVHVTTKDELKTHISSLAKCVATILELALDSSTTFFAYQISSVASTYARVLLFESQSKGETVYSMLLTEVRDMMLYRREALAPANVLPRLCERSTLQVRRFYFSDTAALLHAVAKIYRVVCKQHAENDASSRVMVPSLSSASAAAASLPSRFKKRRAADVNMTTMGNTPTDVPANPPSLSDPTGSRDVSSKTVLIDSAFDAQETHNMLTTTEKPFPVSAEDMAEIEGELEAFLDAFVSLTIRFLPSAPGCKHRRVTLMQSNAPKDAASGKVFTKVTSSEAKKLGGRSRASKKSVGNRELLVIADAIHALSWHHFVVFQERLHVELVSEQGQLEVNASQYAGLVKLLLRAPPLLPSTLYHALADRLKRVIHAEAVTYIASDTPSTSSTSTTTSDGTTTTGASTTPIPKTVSRVLASAHARSLQDSPLSLFDACAVVFAFAQKLLGASLPLLHDLLIRCSQRVREECGARREGATEIDSSVVLAFILFVASVTRVLSNAKLMRCDDVIICFFSSTRSLALQYLSAMDVEPLLKSSLSLADLGHLCTMLEGAKEGDVVKLYRVLRSVFVRHAGRCDDMEVALFAYDITFPSISPSVTSSSCLPDWMGEAMRLETRSLHSKRLSTLTFLPFLVTLQPQLREGENLKDNTFLLRALEVTRLYCRTFATLVSFVQLLHATDTSLLYNTAVIEVVLRKVTQLTRRTAHIHDLFAFFALYGDFAQLTSACLSEIVPEAHCFLHPHNLPVPIFRVRLALLAVDRLHSRPLRQRWLATMKPFITISVSFSRDTPDAVLDFAELVAKSDSAFMHEILMSSSSFYFLESKSSILVEGDIFFRLLVLLQGGNKSNPVARQLHFAVMRMLENPSVRNISLEHLARAVMLPSLEGTVILRRLRRFFIRALWKSLMTDSDSQTFSTSFNSPHASSTPPLGDGMEIKKRDSHWNSEVDQLELQHWLLLLDFAYAGELSSHRIFVELKENEELEKERRRPKSDSGSSALTSSSASLSPLSTSPLSSFKAVTEGEANPISTFPPRHEKASRDVSEEREDHLPFDRNAFRRCYRGISLVLALSPECIVRLRQSLGASDFIYFVCHLLQRVRDMMSMETWEGVYPHRRKNVATVFMPDGGISPLCNEHVKPFVSLAQELVKEMSVDLANFLERESKFRTGPTKDAKTKIKLDIGAVLKFTLAMDAYNPTLYEQRLLSWNDENVFNDALDLALRYLHRLLLQLPQHWGMDSNSSIPTTPMTRVQVQLCNISAVFDYCASPMESLLPPSLTDSECTGAGRRELTDIFGTDRPLITDVFLPLDKVRAAQCAMDASAKSQLFHALIRCLVRHDEPLATTRGRLATLGPRDLACVVQALITSSEESSQAAAVAAVELLTDLLTSSTAHDLRNIVHTLLQLLPNTSSTHHPATCGAVRDVRRLLAHVAVIMGNDTERFPLPLLLEILQQLHSPHRLVSPAAARRMLEGIHADRNASEAKTAPLGKPRRRSAEMETPDPAEDEKEEGEEGTPSGLAAESEKRPLPLTVALLRQIIAAHKVEETDQKEEEGNGEDVIP